MNRTPGQWRTKCAVSQMADEGTTVGVVRGDAAGSEPSHWIFSDAETHGDAAADAALMAAAPDLLDVCEAIVTAFAGNHFPSDVQKHVLDGARAAIARAVPAQ